MQTNSSHNSKFDDWAYIISVLTGPLTVLIAAIIALAASTSLVANETRAKDLMQFATLLLTGGAAVTGTAQGRRAGRANVAMGKEVNVNVEEQPDTTNKSNSKNSWDGRTVVLPKQDGSPDDETPTEPSVENVEPSPEETLKPSTSSSQEVSVPLPAQEIAETNGIRSPRIKDSNTVEFDPQQYDTQP